MGGSKLRAFGDPYSANVVLPEAAADRDDQVGREHEQPGPASRIDRRSPRA